MGQAFDRDGNVLGEATGATKEEVLKALNDRFGVEAKEIRIRSLEEKTTGDVVEPLEKFFAFAHLPEHLRAVSQPFGELAAHIIKTLPRNPERTVALRKLLESKDCAVRSVL
jgi:hypothetical protein